MIREDFELEAIRWTGDVYRFALSMSRDEVEADDVVQETYLRALRSWRTFAPGTDCRRWLFTICRNVFLRGRERARRLVPLEAILLEAVLTHASVDEGMDRSADASGSVDVLTAIERAVDAMPEPFRSVIRVVDIEDGTYEDAASRLGIPVGTVRSRLSRGRRLLHDRLRPYAMDLGFGSGENILRGRGSLA